MNIKLVTLIILFVYASPLRCSDNEGTYQIISQSNRDLERAQTPPFSLSNCFSGSFTSSTESLPDRDDFEIMIQSPNKRCSKKKWCSTAKYAAGAITVLGATAGLTYFASWLGPDLASISQQLPGMHEDLDSLRNMTEAILKIVSEL